MIKMEKTKQGKIINSLKQHLRLRNNQDTAVHGANGRDGRFVIFMGTAEQRKYIIAE